MKLEKKSSMRESNGRASRRCPRVQPAPTGVWDSEDRLDPCEGSELGIRALSGY